MSERQTASGGTEMRRIARVVTVRGAAPGAGSTTMTMLLAAATSQSGLRTCIVGIGAADDRSELEEATSAGAMLSIVESGTAAAAATAVALAVARGCEVVLIDAGAGEEGRFAAANAGGLTTNVVVVDAAAAEADEGSAALAALGRVETNEPRQPAVVVLNRTKGPVSGAPVEEGGDDDGAARTGAARALAEAGWRVAWRSLPKGRAYSGEAMAGGTPTETTLALAAEVIGHHDSDLLERFSAHTARICGKPAGALRRKGGRKKTAETANGRTGPAAPKNRRGQRTNGAGKPGAKAAPNG